MNNFKITFTKFVANCVFIGLVGIGLVGIGMSGCGGASVSPVEHDKLLNFGINNIERNIQNIKDAKDVAKLNFYSPKNLAKAENCAYKALDMHKDKDNKSDIYQQVELSKKYLAKGYKLKTIVKEELKNVFIYKQKMDALHAKELFNSEYSNIYENITDMISNVENGEGIESFKNREETLIKSKKLYSKIKVSSNLHSVKEILNSIDQDIAPQSYQKAIETYQNAEFIINKFPDDEKVIKEKTQEALNEALFAQTIERESKNLMNMEEKIELFVRNEHEKLNAIYLLTDKKNLKFRTLSYNSKTSKLKDITIAITEEKEVFQNEISRLIKAMTKILKDKKALKDENKSLIAKAKISKKSILDLNKKFQQQKLKTRSLEAKIQNSNEQLLKSKDGALDSNTKLLMLQNEITLLKTAIEEEKKTNQEKDEILLNKDKILSDKDKDLLNSKKTIKQLNKKIKSANYRLKKERKNSSKLGNALKDKEGVIKSLKSQNETLKTKSTKAVVKEVAE